jgi:hypothetical protein
VLTMDTAVGGMLVYEPPQRKLSSRTNAVVSGEGIVSVKKAGDDVDDQTNDDGAKQI